MTRRDKYALDVFMGLIMAPICTLFGLADFVFTSHQILGAINITLGIVWTIGLIRAYNALVAVYLEEIEANSKIVQKNI